MRNPFGDGVELAWLIPGIIVVIMGAVPLLAWIGARGHGPVVPGVRSTMTPIELNELASAMRQVTMRAGHARRRPRPSRTRWPTPTDTRQARRPGRRWQPQRPGRRSRPQRPAAGLVDHLERLARLHESGALGDQEYEDAKQAVIGAASRGELG